MPKAPADGRFAPVDRVERSKRGAIRQDTWTLRIYVDLPD
jgi:hypothetical protein